MVPHLHHHRPPSHQLTPSPLAHRPRPTTIRNATTTTTTTPPCWQFSDTLAFVWFTGVSKTVKVINLKLRCRWKEILAKAVIFRALYINSKSAMHPAVHKVNASTLHHLQGRYAQIQLSHCESLSTWVLRKKRIPKKKTNPHHL